MRTIEKIMGCLESCYGNESCSTGNHRCPYGDEGVIDCVDRLKVDYERIMAAIAKVSTLDRLEEICNAEREGRVVVLPNIPHGKTLYWIWGDMIMPVAYRGIYGGCVTKDKKYHINCSMATKKDRTFRHRGHEFTYQAGDKRAFYADDIGKTVFVTREEAEKALKERELIG